MTINEQIRKLRKDQSITTRRLSELTGVSKTIIINFENGKANITMDTLYRITKALGVTLTISTESHFK